VYRWAAFVGLEEIVMATQEMRTSCVLDPALIARDTQGEWTTEPHSPLTGLSLDSRVVRAGDLFVALKGETSDGHRFIDAAIRNGAGAAMVGSTPGVTDPHFPYLRVHDTLAALHALARSAREAFSGMVVALTGSVGKTTVKEMTASILRRLGDTVSTLGNFNNVTGVPLSILQLQRSVKYAVIEVGMSASGEIRSLMSMVRPHVAAVLNVAPVHMENFVSLEEIAAAKAEIFSHLEEEPVVVLNSDDPLVRAMVPGSRIRKLYFGTHPDANLRLGDTAEVTIDVQRFDLFLNGHRLSIELKAPGRHNRINAAAAAALGFAAGASDSAVVEGLAAYRPGMMRSELVNLSDGSLLFDDCYNASPRAFEEALKTFVSLPKAGRRIVVMGDMLELGTDSGLYHRAVGEEAARLGVDVLLGFGPLTRFAVAAFQVAAPGRLCGQYDDLEDLTNQLLDIHQADDMVLVKGSRGMRMERVTERLKAELAASER
jgi:UDP-N-acetylmuramoyl-tripeptide--D-alanyl-D-alanine ligase